jgi:hypothetical protein
MLTAFPKPKTTWFANQMAIDLSLLKKGNEEKCRQQFQNQRPLGITIISGNRSVFIKNGKKKKKKKRFNQPSHIN